MDQLDLFSHVAAAYADAGGRELSNADLYAKLGSQGRVSRESLEEKCPIGKSGAAHSPVKRKIRWYQQTLKALGVIERVKGSRGLWRLAEKASEDLDRTVAGVKLVAFSTDLGVAIWARNGDVFGALGEAISLCVTSPPYPLRTPRAYGDFQRDSEYVDFVCSSLEPIVKHLQPGGSIVLNLSNDIFESKLPSRSLYLERLTIALCDRLGLHLMDRVPWVNYSKPPGPTYWACVNRVQLSAAYEPVLWFTNDPAKVCADNRRVLEPHTERHRRLMASGGARRTAVYGDGAYRLRQDSFGRQTPGKIPRNVIERGHVCSDTKVYREYAKSMGLPIHGAMQPTFISDFWIRFLTEPGDLVVDPFGGTVRAGLAANRLLRRWLVTEWILQFLQGASHLFKGFEGYRESRILQQGVW